MAPTLLCVLPAMRSLLVFGLFLAACAGQDGDAADGGIDAISLGQGSHARGALVVNEVMAKAVDGPDWIELVNRSDVAIDLCDYFVSDSIDRLDHYLHLAVAPPPQECQPSMLDAGAYLVVYADDDVGAGPYHAPFKLGGADEAHVISVRGEVIDSLIYLYPAKSKGLSLARIPSGEGLFWIGAPSMGASNPEEPQ